MYNLSSHESEFQESRKTFEKLPDQHFDFNTSDAGHAERIVQHIRVDKGLYIQIWDGWFDKTIWINPLPAKNNGEVFFTLAYYFIPDSIVLSNKGEPGIQLSKLWNTIFFTSDADFNAEILPGSTVRCFSISFTKEWIQARNLFPGKRQTEFISKIVTAFQPVLFFESYTAFEEKMIGDIYGHSSYSQLGILFIKARVFAIIDHFISKTSERKSLLAPVHVSAHEHIIRQVEARLIQCLENESVNIKELAREFALSASTLKRSFKHVYGKSISDYYLDKKMAYAKRLIHEKNKTVTETAYLLGYEKVGQFIVMFKKYIGCLPGTIRKEAMQCKITI